MKPTQQRHDLGQSLWLDNITRDLLNSVTLKHYVDELSVTGLTSNPTIFDHAIKNSAGYDRAIREGLAKGRTGESLFFDLALDDLTRAADLFRPVYDRTNGVDGWVSLEVSPLLAHDTVGTIAAAKELSERAGRPNLFIKIADHGEIGPIMAANCGDCERGLEQFVQSGVNVDSLAARLQDEGAKSFVKSWNELMAVIASKSEALKKAA